MKTAAIAVLILLATQDVQEDDTVAYGNLLFRRPEGWKSAASEESLILQPPNEPFLVMLFPGTNAEGTLAESFDKAWKQAAGSSKIANKAPGKEMKTEGGTDGLMSVGVLETADGGRMLAAVAVFKPGDRAQTVVALCSRDDVFQRYTEDLGVFLKTLRFRNLELPKYELVGSSEAKPRFYVLFKDGTWLGVLPPEGLDGVDPKKHGAGTDKVPLRADGDGKYTSTDGVVFTRAGASTGLRLQGRYLRHGDEDKPGAPVFGFKADGTFEDVGAVEAANGTGGYEIFNNSLYLTYRDKRRKKLSWVCAAGEKAPEWILVGGVRFDRR
jgi:hypothetical protein